MTALELRTATFRKYYNVSKWLLVEIERIEPDIKDSFDAPESNWFDNLELKLCPLLVLLRFLPFCDD